MENGSKRRTGKDVLLMIYRKICTYAGNDILEKLTEEETAVYYRNKQNRKKKEDRKAEVGAWIGSMIMAGSFFFFIAAYILGGFLQ